MHEYFSLTRKIRHKAPQARLFRPIWTWLSSVCKAPYCITEINFKGFNNCFLDAMRFMRYNALAKKEGKVFLLQKLCRRVKTQLANHQWRLTEE